jgi:hypothetical protein
MRSRDAVDISAVIAVVTAAAASGVLLFLLLSWIAAPTGFGRDMSRMEEGATRAESQFRGGSAGAAFDSGAVCQEDPASQASRLKARVQAAAQAAGVTLGNVAASTGASAGALRGVDLRFQASGRYDQTMSLLAQLANGRPEIFVDTADLTSKVSSVDLSFQGRVFCSAAARL